MNLIIVHFLTRICYCGGVNIVGVPVASTIGLHRSPKSIILLYTGLPMSTVHDRDTLHTLYTLQFVHVTRVNMLDPVYFEFKVLLQPVLTGTKQWFSPHSPQLENEQHVIGWYLATLWNAVNSFGYIRRDLVWGSHIGIV